MIQRKIIVEFIEKLIKNEDLLWFNKDLLRFNQNLMNILKKIYENY